MPEILFNYSGLKTYVQLLASGLNIKSCSSDGDFKIPSYIGIREGKRVYGRYDYQTAVYIESAAPKH